MDIWKTESLYRAMPEAGVTIILFLFEYGTFTDFLQSQKSLVPNLNGNVKEKSCGTGFSDK